MARQKSPTIELCVNALLDLCETKPINKITVSDILRETGIARQTFYNYFQDINSLIAYVMNYHLDLYPTVFDTKEEALASLDFFRKHKAFFSQLPKHSGQNNFRESHIRKLKGMYYQLVFQTDDPPTDSLQKSLIDMYVYGSVNFFFDWLSSEMTEPSDDVFVETYLQAKPAFISSVVVSSLMPQGS